MSDPSNSMLNDTAVKAYDSKQVRDWSKKSSDSNGGWSDSSHEEIHSRPGTNMPTSANVTVMKLHQELDGVSGRTSQTGGVD